VPFQIIQQHKMFGEFLATGRSCFVFLNSELWKVLLENTLIKRERLIGPSPAQPCGPASHSPGPLANCFHRPAIPSDRVRHCSRCRQHCSDRTATVLTSRYPYPLAARRRYCSPAVPIAASSALPPPALLAAVLLRR
jgi:hypothetical protein